LYWSKVASDLATRGISLPSSVGLTEGKVLRVANALKHAFELVSMRSAGNRLTSQKGVRE
jgi:hypothetical protein